MFDKWPRFMLSVVVLIAILCLTLDGDAMGVDVGLFEGSDKVAHAIMFAGLSVVLCLDLQRADWSHCISWTRSVLVFAVASIIGVAVEFMQLYMPTGRSFEVEDMIADAVGALVGTLVFRLILRHVDH